MKSIQRKITVGNSTENLAKVRVFVTQAMRDADVNKEDENRIILAVDEAVSNIIEHAFENTLEGAIKIEIDLDSERCVVVIHDSGKKFDPLSVEPLNLDRHIKAGRKRGLGIFLMRQIMDEVKYHYKTGVENILTLVKNLS